MFTALLAALVHWCLLTGSMPAPWPELLGTAIGCLLLFGRHSHGGTLTMDVLSRRSRFLGISAPLKAAGCLMLLVLCILSSSPLPPLLLFAVMALLTLLGGIHLHDYLSLLSLPAVFLLLGGLTLLWEYGADPSGVVSIPLGQGFLVLTAAAQKRAGLVMARSVGAVSCLYFLSLSTPVPELLETLRRLKVPETLISLAALIYRYIFILLSTCRRMKDAAESRLGYGSLRQSLLTTGKVYGNLLACSFRKAGACFDAMESRCCDGEVRFLTARKPLTLPHLLLFGGLIAAMTAAVLLIP